MRKQEEGTNVAADEYWFERLVGSRGLSDPLQCFRMEVGDPKQSVPSPSGGTGLLSLVVLLICNVCCGAFPWQGQYASNQGWRGLGAWHRVQYLVIPRPPNFL